MSGCVVGEVGERGDDVDEEVEFWFGHFGIFCFQKKGWLMMDDWSGIWVWDEELTRIQSLVVIRGRGNME